QMATLFQLRERSDLQALVLPAAALLQKVIPPGALRGLSLQLGASVAVERVIETLSAIGYSRMPLVEDAGTFAVRGGLLDVWPVQLERPVRIELLGDEVVSIKSFHPDSQRTLAQVNDIDVPPSGLLTDEPRARERARAQLTALCDAVNLPSRKARELIDGLTLGHAPLGLRAFLPAFHELVAVTEYLPKNALVVIEDPPRFVAALRAEWDAICAAEPASTEPHFSPDQLATPAESIAELLQQHRVVCLHRSAAIAEATPNGLAAFEFASPDAPRVALQDHADLQRALKAPAAAGGKALQLDALFKSLAEFREQTLRVQLAARTVTQAKRLQALLEHHGIIVQFDTSPAAMKRQAPPPEVEIVVGELRRGLIAQLSGFVLLTEEEIFGVRSHRSAPSSKAAKNALDDLRTLQVGDFVVHTEHGIGRYLGLEHKKLSGHTSVELLVIEYAQNNRLLLPVYRLNQLTKYLGKDGDPKLDRLGGATFARTKSKVRRRVREMADELLRLYAERAQIQKLPLAKADDDYAAFEAQFPFEETPDQAAAIADIAKDLEDSKVMDRLVCGDVGFGKTEVALRAAFRHAMSGRQVGLLCPTTVLAQQHFQTISRRFANTPLRMRVLSRFQSKADQLLTVEQIRNGEVDLVVGTHRLLSRDIHFKNLGLLIVDEEQRFGVAHKERIKQLCTNVDVLTLTATPIPRTLQLAVGGLRDLSVIATPPTDRRAIRTLVASHDEGTITQVVRRELQRGGQVYYVYNRVEGIDQRALRLGALVPEARIAVAHGQMKEWSLEQIMLQFVRGDFDVLVCTAIIESGLDIPRANTMIIDQAQLFGLAQLHQLRGRVGRSPVRAYCYLLVPPPSTLSGEARARIEALAQYSELGSGLNLATLDMELRGVGNLLGAEQSGSVASVGFQLFCQMLAEASDELRGVEVVHEVDPDLSFDVEALLPESYIEEVGLRLTLYKRLASAVDDAEVLALAMEAEDRFGAPPIEVERLVELMRLKVELRSLRVLACEASARSVTLLLKEDTPVDRSKLQQRITAPHSLYRFTPDHRLQRRLGGEEAPQGSIALCRQTVKELFELC
ncbi:MAG TPA: transcription-repair coupling factor, partial [Polyangiaceae bacterium]|nr:transcription-repair coupling factor [Polyangiaceae bacterium]